MFIWDMLGLAEEGSISCCFVAARGGAAKD